MVEALRGDLLQREVRALLHYRQTSKMLCRKQIGGRHFDGTVCGVLCFAEST